jgi:hypothetical protein
MPTPAADDFATIRSRLAELSDASIPRCPRAERKRLYDCLREKQRCPEECPEYNNWLGPDAV